MQSQTERGSQSQLTETSSPPSQPNQDSPYIIPAPLGVRAGRGPLSRRSTPYDSSCLVLSCQREERVGGRHVRGGREMVTTEVEGEGRSDQG